MLSFFSSNPNRVFPRVEVQKNVFLGYAENMTRAYVGRLRAKIEEDPANPTRLVTVGNTHGSHGYMFKRPERNGAR